MADCAARTCSHGIEDMLLDVGKKKKRSQSLPKFNLDRFLLPTGNLPGRPGWLNSRLGLSIIIACTQNCKATGHQPKRTRRTSHYVARICSSQTPNQSVKGPLLQPRIPTVPIRLHQAAGTVGFGLAGGLREAERGVASQWRRAGDELIRRHLEALVRVFFWTCRRGGSL